MDSKKRESLRTPDNKKIIIEKSGRVRVQSVNPGESMTQQQFEPETDVNRIMARYQKTGQMPLLKGPGKHGDFTSAKDYFEAMNTVTQADQMFNSLPSHIRSRFANDPAQLLEFLKDKNSLEEGIKLGLYQKPAEKNKENQNQNNPPPENKPPETLPSEKK